MTAFADDPASFFGNDMQAAERLPLAELEALQREALKARFAALRDRLPPLRALAEAQGIRNVESVDDVVPLLFPHSLYKSYAPQLMEQLRFDEMTRWVSRLTVCDLSPLLGETFESIDGWLDAMDSRTDLLLLLSSGTTGGLSLVPRARADHEAHGRHIGMVAARFRARAPNGNLQVIWPAYARGKQAALRSVDHIITHIAGDPERFHPLIDAEMSADIQFYTARSADRMMKGITGALPVYPQLRARLDEQHDLQRRIPEMRRDFLDHIVTKLRGKQVDLFGGPVLLHQIASEALAEGHQGVFAPGSVITMFGGTKGFDLPADWLETILAFTGPVDRFVTYGMTELTCDAMLCEEGRFHCASTTIPFVLDGTTGAPLPRSGVQSGRAAFFDLLPRSSWGGIVTSDHVEIDWSPCPCGRTAPHFSQDIERLDDGPDDEWAIGATDFVARRAAFDSLNVGLA